MDDCWDILGLEPTDDRRAIKRAYAKELKKHSPEDDPQGFQRVREAYEDALASADEPGSRTSILPITPASFGESPRPREHANADHPDAEFRHSRSLAGQMVAAILEDDNPVQTFLRTLEDPRLADLSTSETFEVELASKLADGAGSPRLTVVATRRLDWTDVHHPLRRRFPTFFEHAGDLARGSKSHQNRRRAPTTVGGLARRWLAMFSLVTALGAIQAIASAPDDGDGIIGYLAVLMCAIIVEALIVRRWIRDRRSTHR